MKQRIPLFSYPTVCLLLATYLFVGCQVNSTTSEPQQAVEVTKVNKDETVVHVEAPTAKAITSAEIPDIASAYNFTAEIPATWQVEYIPAIEAINIYDPEIEIDNEASSTLEQSQIFIRYFSANDFLTLSTVTIHSRTTTEINGRPAVVYDIEKKPGVANFPAQPVWRNTRHGVTDIRSTDSNPTVFYVFAKNPELDQTVFDTVVESVRFE